MKDLYERVREFGSRVLKMERVLARSPRVNRNALRQLSDSATAVGSNLEEARGAQSRPDYYAKLKISVKEAREAHYWLRVLADSQSISVHRIAALTQEANELVAILTSIAKKQDPKNRP